MPPNSPQARQLAHRLIGGSKVAKAQNADSASSVALAFDNLYQSLSRWVGLNGCHALFARAHTHAKAEHPLLENIQLRARTAPYLDGVTETIDEYGVEETVQALESMLVTLIELLGRLIGDDMAQKLIERDLAEFPREDANGENLRAEA